MDTAKSQTIVVAANDEVALEALRRQPALHGLDVHYRVEPKGGSTPRAYVRTNGRITAERALTRPLVFELASLLRDDGFAPVLSVPSAKCRGSGKLHVHMVPTMAVPRLIERLAPEEHPHAALLCALAKYPLLQDRLCIHAQAPEADGTVPPPRICNDGGECLQGVTACLQFLKLQSRQLENALTDSCAQICPL